MASFGLQVIRGAFTVGERLAPRLSGRVAFGLFCRTPSVHRQTDGERRAVARATAFMSEARHHRLKSGSGCVSVHEFRPSNGVQRGRVLVIHGWRSRTEYMRSLIEAYRDAGFRVYSLDLPGHGQSSGRRLNIVNAVEAAHLAGLWFGPFDAVVGHSFGGAVAVNAVVGAVERVAPLPADRLVLIAAPSSLPDIFADFSRILNVGPRSQAAMEQCVERISGRRLEEYHGHLQLSAHAVPTLVMHAPEDREVAAHHARLYAGAGNHVQLHWAEGQGHRRILVHPGVVERAVQFVASKAEATR